MQNKFLLFLIPLLMCGCSDNGFLFRSGSEYEDAPVKSVYYIGAPYRIKGVLYTPKEDDTYNEKGLAAWYSKDDSNRLTTNGEVFDDNEMTAAHKTLPLPSLVRITNLENGNTAIVRVNDRGPAVNNRLIDVSQKTAEALEFPETGTTLVQVEILPEESRQLREKLEHYITPDVSETDVIQTGDNQPIYKPEDTGLTPIYNGNANGSEMVEAEDLPVIESPKSNPGAAPVLSGHFIQVGVFGNPQNVERAVQTLSPDMAVQTISTGTRTTVLAGPFKNKAEATKMLDKVQQSGYSDAWVKLIK